MGEYSVMYVGPGGGVSYYGGGSSYSSPLTNLRRELWSLERRVGLPA